MIPTRIDRMNEIDSKSLDLSSRSALKLISMQMISSSIVAYMNLKIMFEIFYIMVRERISDRPLIIIVESLSETLLTSQHLLARRAKSRMKKMARMAPKLSNMEVFSYPDCPKRVFRG